MLDEKDDEGFLASRALVVLSLVLIVLVVGFALVFG